MKLTLWSVSALWLADGWRFLLAMGMLLAAERMAPAAPAEEWAGRWNLTILELNRNQLPSWLELKLDQGRWRANFVGRWGNVRSLPKVVIKLHVEVNCPTNANSGIYLRGRYEVQVEDDSLQEPPSHHMGAVYGFLAPAPEQPRRSGIWQVFDITLVGRFVTVVQNGQTIIDNQEIPGITGGALESHEDLPGPIYLQGDHGGIAFRNLVLTPGAP